jgi:hypothetical protein
MKVPSFRHGQVAHLRTAIALDEHRSSHDRR